MNFLSNLENTMNKTISYDEMMQRSRALKKLMQPAACADRKFADMFSRVQAKISAALQEKNSQNASAPSLPTGARTLGDILAELNSISDPCDQTIYWREHYAEIKRAQDRERYAAASRPRNKFLNMTLPD